MTQSDFRTRNGLVVNNNILVVNATSGTVGINTTSTSVTFTIAANDGIIIPIGNTGQRPSAAKGILRYNTDTDVVEVANSTTYVTFQTTAGLAANVTTLTANNTLFVGTVSAANVVSNAQLISNLANYQTSVGMAANVTTLTANTTLFVGTVSAANVVSNAQLIANLANYQTSVGLAANIATLTANNSTNWGGAHTFGAFLNQAVLTTSNPTFNTLITSISVTTPTIYGQDAAISVTLQSYNAAPNPALFTLSGNGASSVIQGQAKTYNLYNQAATILYAQLIANTGWVNGSDLKLKKNPETFLVLDKLINSDFRTVTFDWIEIEEKGIGVIAQEVEQVFPEVVSDMGPHLGVDYSKMGALALMAVKELADEVKQLRSEIAQLKGK